MVRLPEMPSRARSMLEPLEMPAFETPAWTPGPPAAERRVAVVSSAGLQARGERPFRWADPGYRAFDADDVNLVMSHVAVDYDRTGWQQDLDVVLPVRRLRELAAVGEIGGVAQIHYSFMGAVDPLEFAPAVKEIASRMREEEVNTVLLVPV